MLLLEGNKVSFRHDQQDDYLLEEISFSISKESKIGLIGKNGAGKSTLFYLIMGKINNYKGVIKRKKDIRVGYLPQELHVKRNTKVNDYLWQVHLKLFSIKSKVESFSSGTLVNDKDIGYIFSLYDELGGYQMEVQVEKFIEKFQLRPSILKENLENLSCGEKTKISLIRIFLSNPQLILFDEPTNHLDLTTLKWLESYLINLSIPIIMISHDRTFLDKSVKEIWEIKSKHLRAFSGNFSFYKETLSKERKRDSIQYERQQKKIRQLSIASEKIRVTANRMDNFKHQRSIKKNGGICKRDDGSGGGKANPTKKMNAAKAFEKRIDIMIKKEKCERPVFDKKKRFILSTSKVPKNKRVLRVESLSKSYSYELFSNISISLKQGQRLAIIGKNGIGKSTLLNIIMGIEKADQGLIFIPSSLSVSYYAQRYNHLNPQDSILDEVAGGQKNFETRIRTLLGSLGLQGNKVFQKVQTLSQGERSKVLLAKTVLSEANLLILDEPTNHLEIEAREALEDALKLYKGTLLFVSHDRRFIEKIADSLFDLEQGSLKQCSVSE